MKSPYVLFSLMMLPLMNSLNEAEAVNIFYSPRTGYASQGEPAGCSDTLRQGELFRGMGREFGLSQTTCTPVKHGNIPAARPRIRKLIDDHLSLEAVRCSV